MSDFFARLPAGHLNPLEEQLRDLLHQTAKTAAKLLPRSGSVSLQEWVEHRMPRELVLGTNPQGKVKIAPLVPQEKELDVKKMSDDFFASLPTDEFTPEEENLRDAVLDVIRSQKVPLNIKKLVAEEPIMKAKMFLPRAVRLEEWIENRIGQDVHIKTDELGNKTYKLRGHNKEEKEQLVDEFFQNLPVDSFTPAEDRLRDALHAYLARTPRHMHHLSGAGGDPEIKGPRRELLESAEVKVGLKEWIEQRIGGEIVVQKEEGSSQYMLRLAGDTRPAAGAAKPRKGGKGFEKAAGKPPAAGKASVGGKAPVASKANGKGVDRAAVEDEERAAKHEELEKKRDDFFAMLPKGTFSEYERELRDALLDYLNAWTGSTPPSLSTLGSEERIKAARAALLPKDGGVSLRLWIEHRIGGEIVCEQPESGREVIVYLRDGNGKGRKGKDKGVKSATYKGPPHFSERPEEKAKGKGKKGGKAASQAPPVGKSAGGKATSQQALPDDREHIEREEMRESFFAGLPEDSLTEPELDLHEAVLGFLEEHEGDEFVPSMSNLGSDERVKSARARLLPKGVSMKVWIDRRIGGEVECQQHGAKNETFIWFRGQMDSEKLQRTIERESRKQEEARSGEKRRLPPSAQAMGAPPNKRPAPPRAQYLGPPSR